uniref:Uncharacterized protein n=1 Tax=Marseillevirus LCMAC201 TaxID=2506605 RepID=A0A481YX18_9VIRU|nr:MAG: hypothetical protein LCMAC201_00160 [Marseillevirus LCMAC201]
MSFRIAKDEIVTSLNAIRRLKIPIYTTLPTNLAGTGGYFAGLSVAGGGVDLYYFDGDIWFKVVDSSAPSGGLPNTLAINNNSGGVNNIILDNTINSSVGALTSVAAGDLNILAGAGVGSVPLANTADVRIASGTGAAGVNIEAGTGGVDVDTTGGISLDGGNDSNFTTTTGGLALESTIGIVTITAGEANAGAVHIEASNAAGGIVLIPGTAGTVQLGDASATGGNLLTPSVTASTAAAAVPVTGMVHEITTTGTGDALTLVDGTNGQHLVLIYVAEAGGADTAILTPTTLAGGATITFNALGDAAHIYFSSTGGWYFLGGAAVVA